MLVRIIGNSLLSVLMVATLLWGGCVACPQFFMFPGIKKDCCKVGQCERSKPQKSSPSKQCNRMPLERTGAAQLPCAEVPTRVVATIDLSQPTVLYGPACDTIAAVEHSPPDLLALNATFLI